MKELLENYIKENETTVVKVSKFLWFKYRGSCSGDIELDDLKQEGYLALINSYASFDDSRTIEEQRFWIFRWIWNFVLAAINKSVKNKSLSLVEEYLKEEKFSYSHNENWIDIKDSLLINGKPRDSLLMYLLCSGIKKARIARILNVSIHNLNYDVDEFRIRLKNWK